MWTIKNEGVSFHLLEVVQDDFSLFPCQILAVLDLKPELSLALVMIVQDEHPV